MTDALTDALETVETSKEPDPVQEESPAAPFIDTLVGEGRKYSSSEDLAKAYHHANLHIEELKSDLDEFKGGREAVNELLNEIRSSKREEGTEAPAEQYAPADTSVPAEEVAKIVESRLDARAAEDRAKANVNSAMQKLTAVYGSDIAVKAAVTKAIKQDPAMKDTIDDLSRRSPDTVVKFLTGVVPVEQPESNTPGVSDTPTPVPEYSGNLTWEECRRIRKENPKLYRSSDFRKNMEHAAASAADKGVDFFAT